MIMIYIGTQDDVFIQYDIYGYQKQSDCLVIAACCIDGTDGIIQLHTQLILFRCSFCKGYICMYMYITSFPVVELCLQIK